MKCADPNSRTGDKRFDAMSHFLCGLIGKRQAEDISRRDASLNQARDAMCDDSRLTGSGASKDQQRPLEMFDGGSLRFGQTALHNTTPFRRTLPFGGEGLYSARVSD